MTSPYSPAPCKSDREEGKGEGRWKKKEAHPSIHWQAANRRKKKLVENNCSIWITKGGEKEKRSPRVAQKERGGVLTTVIEAERGGEEKRLASWSKGGGGGGHRNAFLHQNELKIHKGMFCSYRPKRGGNPSILSSPTWGGIQRGNRPAAERKKGEKAPVRDEQFSKEEKRRERCGVLYRRRQSKGEEEKEGSKTIPTVLNGEKLRCGERRGSA